MLRSLSDHLTSITDHLWPWAFIWLTFGIARLTQVVLFDRILDDPRRWWLRKVNPHNYEPGDDRLGLWGYMSMCIFCMSLDIGLVIVFLLFIPIIGDLVVMVLIAATASYFTPLLDHWQDKLLADKDQLNQAEREAWMQGGVVPSPTTAAGPPTLAEVIAAQADSKGS